MRRFAGVFLAVCIAAAVPMAGVCFAEEVGQTESAPEVSSEEFNIAQSLEGITLPANCEQITYTYHGVVYETAAKTSTGLYLLPVVQDDASVVWYVYNEEVDDAIPYVDFNGESISYAIILPGSDVTAPAGYEEVQINVAGRTLPAWFNSQAGDANMYLIYAMDSNGNQGFYRFDGTTGNCIRFVFDPDVEAMSEASSLSDELSAAQSKNEELQSQYNEEVQSLESNNSQLQQDYNDLSDQHEQYSLYGMIIIGGLGVLLLIFIILCITKSAKTKKLKKRLAQAEKAANDARQHARRAARARESANFAGDTRMTEGREEGTSRVRRTQRVSGEGFENSTTTSGVRVRREAQVRRDAEQAAASRQPQTAQRKVRKVQQEQPTVRTRQAAKESKPTGETKIFAKEMKSAAQESADTRVREFEELENLKPKAETDSSIRMTELDKIGEQISYDAENESPVEDSFIEVESTQPDKSDESDGNSVYEADYEVDYDEDDDDFSLTDFKDI